MSVTQNFFKDQPKTLVEIAYRQIYVDIMEGRLVPGQRLRVEHLKGHYNVGAATLREALVLLVADSLVIGIGQRGFRVKPMSLHDIKDITETRVMLETEALRQSMLMGDEHWEEALITSYYRLAHAHDKLEAGSSGINEWEDRNRAFHEALISASPSNWIRRFLVILFRQSERYRRLSVITKPIQRDGKEEHEAIFKATLARDAELASQLLASHIRLTYEGINNMPPEFFEESPLTLAEARSLS
jgi:GntR family carbon starvation induced transcriptional regulator